VKPPLVEARWSASQYPRPRTSRRPCPHGVPPADREEVFERFVRLDPAPDRSAGGAGLGLVVVRETVVAHGGAVRIEDSPLGGARFVVTFPSPP
jgi:signal transduction histidine kinase